MALQIIFLLLISASVNEAIQCYSYSNYQQEGTIYKTDVTQIECQGDYCMTISEEGSDFNQFNGTCPDNSLSITNCQIKGNDCQKTKIGGVYIKVCCCDIELCNKASSQVFLWPIFVFLLVLFNV